MRELPVPCSACGSASVMHDRVRRVDAGRTLDVFACEQCGDWWLSSDGTRLTIRRLRALGLIEPPR